MPKRDNQKRIDTRAAALVGGGGGSVVVGGGTVNHALDSAYHFGTLADAQAPQFLKTDGSRVLTGNLVTMIGVTIDGVDLDVHAANPAAHHNPASGLGVIAVSAGQAVSLTLRDANPGLGVTGGLHLGVPASISVASTNAVSGESHTHQVIAYSDAVSYPGQLLRSDASSNLILNKLTATEVNAPNILRIAPTAAAHFADGTTVRNEVFASTIPSITGWQINEVIGVPGWYALTIGAIKADELRVRVFVADETRVDRGEEFWGRSFGIVAEAFTMPAVIGGTVTVYFEDSPAIDGAIFSVNDWLMFQLIDMSGGGFNNVRVWGQVSNYNALTGVTGRDNQQSWTFTLRFGTSGAWGGTDTATPVGLRMPVGSVAVDFGQSGQGMIHLSTVDPSGAPFIRFSRWQGANPYTPANITTNVQIGALTNYSSPAGTPAGTYGIFASNGTNAYAELSDAGVILRNASINQYSGANKVVEFSSVGRVRFGSNVALDSATGFQFTPTSGDLTIGRLTGQNLTWDESAATLFFTGTLVVSGSAYAVKDTNLRGWVVDEEGIVGQYDGVDQVVLDTAGRVVAGAGGVLLDRSGMRIGTRSYIANDFSLDSDGMQSITWWMHPLTDAGMPLARQWVDANELGDQTRWSLGLYPPSALNVPPFATPPVVMMLEHDNVNDVGFLYFGGLTSVAGLPGLYLSSASGLDPNMNEIAVQIDTIFRLAPSARFVSAAHLETAAGGFYDLGSALNPWRTLYVQQIVADNITGGTQLTGQIWQYDAGDMYIRSSGAADRTLYVANPGTGSMHLSVEGNISAGGTVDGVDVSALNASHQGLNSSYQTHVGNANAHHSRAHVLATTSGLTADHTVSGLTAGQVLRATGASTAAFGVLQHDQLGGITANDHHSQTHILATISGLGADHTVSGLTAGQVLRATGAATAAFGVLQHDQLGGLGDDDHAQYVHTSSARTITARHTFNPSPAGPAFTVGANAQHQWIAGLNADRVDGIDLVGSAQYQVLVTGETFSPAWTGISSLVGGGLTWATNVIELADSVAGSGLGIASKVLNVGAGTLIAVGANTVGLADGTAQYQVPVTQSLPYTPAWKGLGDFAGDGLVWLNGQYVINPGVGIEVAGASRLYDTITQRGAATNATATGVPAGYNIITQRGSTTIAAGAGTSGGYQTIVRRGAATSGNAYTDELLVSLPAGVVAGDLLIAVVTWWANGMTPPAGWTQIGSTRTWSSSGDDVFARIYYRVAGASEPPNYSWMLDTINDIAVTIVAYANVDTGNPIADSAAQTQASASITAPGVSAATPADMLVFLGAAGFDGAGGLSATPPSGMTEINDATGATWIKSYAAQQLLSSAGATGTRTATLAGAGGNAGFLVALRPVSLAAGDTEITVDVPVGTLQNDVMLAAVSYAGGSLAAPAGWTLVTAQAATGVTLAVYRRTAGAAEPSTYTWGLNSTDGLAVAVSSYYNVDTAAVIGAFDSQANASSTSMSAPGITPATAADMLLFVGAVAGNVRATPPAGMTETADAGTSGASVYMAQQVLASDAGTGGRAATLASAAANAGALISLRPTTTSGTTAITSVNRPVGVVAGDVLIALVAYAGSALIPAAGWSLVRTVTGAGVSLAAYVRPAIAGEPSAYDWALGAAGTLAVTVVAHTNVQTVAPIDASNGQANASSTSMLAPAVYTTTPADVLLFAGGAAGNVRATAPSGMSELVDVGENAASVYLARQVLSAAGDTGTRAATLVSATGNAAMLIALNPTYTASGTPSVGVDEEYDFLWTGAHTFANALTARNILPQFTDTYDIGSETLWWRQQFVSQINATIFAEQTIQLFGGWLMVTKNAVTLPAVASTQTQIDFGTLMTVGDFVLVRSHDAAGSIRVEYMQIGTLVNGTTYNVTRDVAGAHTTDPTWPEGTPAAVLGKSNNGRIEMSAYASPRMSVIVQGATYNSQTEVVRLGDLNGMPGIASTQWGVYIGDASQYIRYYNGTLTLAGNGSGLTSISGGNITTGSITATQIAAGTITTNLLNFTPVQSSNVVASINASAEGLRIQGNRIQIDGNVVFTAGYDPTTKIAAGGAAADVNTNTTTISGGKITANTITISQLNFTPVQSSNVVASINASGEGLLIQGNRIQIDGNVTFSPGYNPATKIAAGGAAADVNANTTTINGGKITANTITATQISVSTLSAISANMGTVTAGSIVIGTTNRLWLNDAGDGGLAIGGSAKATAPFRVSSSGGLVANNATVSGNLYTGGGNVVLDGNGVALVSRSGWTDLAQSHVQWYDSPAARTGYSGRISMGDMDATGSNSGVAIEAVTRGVYPADIWFNGNRMWHAGNDGSGSGLDADTVDGVQASAFARLTGGTFTGSVVISGSTSAFSIIDRDGADSWAMYHQSGVLRWWNGVVGDAVQLSWGGTLVPLQRFGYDWVAPSLASGWGNWGLGWATAGYTRSGDWVTIRGLVSPSVNKPGSSVIFTLPGTTGSDGLPLYRPAHNRRFYTITSVGAANLDVNSDGQVYVSAAINVGQWASIECTFKAN